MEKFSLSGNILYAAYGDVYHYSSLLFYLFFGGCIAKYIDASIPRNHTVAAPPIVASIQFRTFICVNLTLSTDHWNTP